YVDDGGFIDVKKVTVFIGNQASGRSTVAKVISTLMWLERAINRGDIPPESITIQEFKNQFEYQNLHEYFKLDTVIDYVGNKYSITYDNYKNQLSVIAKKQDSDYVVPTIMYVPSERNFLSVINDAYSVRG